MFQAAASFSVSGQDVQCLMKHQEFPLFMKTDEIAHVQELFYAEKIDTKTTPSFCLLSYSEQYNVVMPLNASHYF